MLAKKEQAEFTTKGLAKEAMSQAEGEVLAATQIMEKWCRDDMKIWQLVTGEILRTACYNLMRDVCHAERRQIYLTTGYNEGGNGDRIKEHARSLFDWPLPGGKRLGDATKPELLSASSFYQKQSETMAIISAWLNKIAAKVKKGKVSDALTEQQIEDLRNDTK